MLLQDKVYICILHFQDTAMVYVTATSIVQKPMISLMRLTVVILDDPDTAVITMPTIPHHQCKLSKLKYRDVGRG